MSLLVSRWLFFRTIFVVFTSALQWAQCSLYVKGTRVLPLLRLHICGCFSCFSSPLGCSGWEGICVGASWPDSESVLPTGLPWYEEQRSEPRCRLQGYRKRWHFAGNGTRSVLLWFFCEDVELEVFAVWDKRQFRSDSEDPLCPRLQKRSSLNE